MDCSFERKESRRDMRSEGLPLYTTFWYYDRLTVFDYGRFPSTSYSGDGNLKRGLCIVSKHYIRHPGEVKPFARPDWWNQGQGLRGVQSAPKAPTWRALLCRRICGETGVRFRGYMAPLQM
jgi:hypothetical protein